MKETRKKFLGVMFECCNIYQRIYVNKEGNAYEGRCPKCFAEVKALIGAEFVLVAEPLLIFLKVC
jgi:hypothetical protein